MKETLCWSCRVPGTGGCEWDRDFKPVEGWEANPTKLRLWEKGGNGTDSFCVISCPKYQKIESGRKSDGRASPMSEDMLERFLFLGFTDREIARRTGLAVCTVKKRRLNFWKKQKEQENERKDG